MQSKKESLLEVIINTLLGHTLAVTGQIIIFPWFGLKTSISDNLEIGFLFMIISIIRSYIIRRIFNRRRTHVRAS